MRAESDIHDSTNPYDVWNADYDDYFYYTHEGAVAVRHDDANAWKIFTRWGRELISCSEGYYYIQNIRGDVVMLIDAETGEAIAIRDYDASGQMLCKAPRDRDPFGFTGGMDAGNGLWKLGARYYDSGKSAFIQQDRYLGNPSDPLSLNRYVYCGLDPVNFVDPTGFSVEKLTEEAIRILENAKNGAEFEELVLKLAEIAKNTLKLESGKIPDGLVKLNDVIQRLVEVKGGKYIHKSRQLTEFINAARDKLELYVREGAKLSAPLKEALKQAGSSVWKVASNGIASLANLSEMCFIPGYLFINPANILPGNYTNSRT